MVSAEIGPRHMGAQNQDGKQARDQGRQRRARIVGQGADQSACGHVGAHAMQGVVDAVGVRLGRRCPSGAT